MATACVLSHHDAQRCYQASTPSIPRCSNFRPYLYRPCSNIPTPGFTDTVGDYSSPFLVKRGTTSTHIVVDRILATPLRLY
jgi:hypothetical protein